MESPQVLDLCLYLVQYSIHKMQVSLCSVIRVALSLTATARHWHVTMGIIRSLVLGCRRGLRFSLLFTEHIGGEF